MKIYLVGGAVRDSLLHRPVTERDWVVVGATPQEMVDLGYTPVGRDFPVFLHPETKEEYALARTERKSGPGYTGFDCYAGPEVTLLDDLKRRDLTINAMAQEESGAIIDPYGGQRDLTARILRHVSPAFEEDPLRILRIARFAARFADLGFAVAPETLTLLRKMTARGDLSELVPERVWQEMHRALGESHAERFFEVLKEADALAAIVPPFRDEALFVAGMARLERATERSQEISVRLAAAFSALGQEEIASLASAWRFPSRERDLALLTTQHAQTCRSALDGGADEVVRLLEALDAFRKSARFHDFLAACAAIDGDEAALTLLLRCFERAASIGAQDADSRAQGIELGAAIRRRRVEAVEQLLAGARA